MNHINTVSEQNAEFFNVKSDDVYNFYYAFSV
jgi:hypothetical protein